MGYVGLCIVLAIVGYFVGGIWGAVIGFCVLPLFIGIFYKEKPTRTEPVISAKYAESDPDVFDPHGPPTGKQLGFIDHLRQERKVPRRLRYKEPETLAEASRLIDQFLECEYKE